jgi:broad specificity phosphatase PhoE
MGAIYLVRHGQASFGAENYDQLSPLGMEQTRLLGEWQRACELPLSKVVIGPARRHAQSAEHFQSGSQTRHAPLLIPGLNEFDHEQVLYRYRPDLREKAALAAYLSTTANPRRAFQDLFAVAVERWLSGEFDEEYAESWPSFQQRCWKGLHQIIEQAGPSQDIWVFTSGGPITAIAQQLLTIPDSHIFNLNWSLVNAGVTRLLYSGNRLSLSYLNNHAHLEQHRRADLVTYR